MYHTYLYDFYENPPDISIFVHAHEKAWHVDAALQQSMTSALSQLDLEQVLKKHYFNLRISWKDACPAWINTTKTPDESTIREEPLMAEAFRANFGADIGVPEILAGPCCSQFAVTREAIRRNPRDQYRQHMDWLISTEWDDYFSGRVWEHMWPWLFLREATDCTDEWLAFCRMYRICFAGSEDLALYQRHWDEKEALKERTEFLNELFRPWTAKQARARMDEIDSSLNKLLSEAITRGNDSRFRGEAAIRLLW